MKSTRSGIAIPLMLRLALRDLKGGFSGFRIFLACIALGVAAITGVGSVSEGLSDGLARESRTILGGDVSLSLIHRELSPEERAFISARGSVSTARHGAPRRREIFAHRSEGDRLVLSRSGCIDHRARDADGRCAVAS
jgi:predicted lysophospholipase L1 biosynthesis ABC-type transport system permease subunit